VIFKEFMAQCMVAANALARQGYRPDSPIVVEVDGGEVEIVSVVPDRATGKLIVRTKQRVRVQAYVGRPST
jgi:hypothetical protein